MGFSCSTNALRTLKKVAFIARDGCFESNVIVKNGERIGYFEATPMELRGGAITGKVFRYLPYGYAECVGTFRIDGDGTIKHFPLVDIQAVNAAKVSERDLSMQAPI